MSSNHHAMQTKETILARRNDGPASNNDGRSVGVNGTTDDETDDELGASIYKSSHTAKARSEAATRAASNAPATHKSERVVCEKHTSRVAGGMSVPDECSVISNDDGLGPNCNPRQKKDVLNKRKLRVDQKDDDPVTPKRVRKMCSVAECTNKARKGGVCHGHGATGPTCSHEGCTASSRKGGVCYRHR
mmetsp:Transcript_12341/g.26814  ORF Transcript_12341/g.26814 Transcript_12341/m.26814 type:complete len:189 (-) Transcript_12341:62-628(-)